MASKDQPKLADPPRLLPGVYTIPARRAFVDALAEGLVANFAGTEPEALARVRVLLPTRRACRSLQESFLRLSEGVPVILPRLQPLGDVDEEALLLEDSAAFADVALDLPPAISPLKRVALLAETMTALPATKGPATKGPATQTSVISGAHAVKLAQDLARFLDAVQTEGCDLENLRALAPGDYAEHWQKVLDFLLLLKDAWPKRLAAAGLMDPAERRRMLMERLAESWRNAPPQDPIVVAGSTGSLPATAQLIETVLTLPQGFLLLAGLDQESTDESWQAILEDGNAPQHGLARLLAGLGIERNRVQVWPYGKDAAPIEREALLNLAMLPAPGVANWLRATDQDKLKAGLKGLSVLACTSPAQEARVIALALRETLEHDGKRAALVTPDRNLARRVAAEMGRWGVVVDDSGGQPLLASPPGRFLRSLAEALSSGLAPVALLAALKHPLAAGGMTRARWIELTLEAENKLLRGLKPPPGLEGLGRRLTAWAGENKKNEPLLAALGAWYQAMTRIWQGPTEVFAGESADFADLLRAHVALAEGLAGDQDQPGAARLWRGEDGEALATFLADLLQASEGVGKIAPADYAGLFLSYAAGQATRSTRGRHPRLSILGPLEARLQHFDLLVLGGLNEGSWPGDVEPGPWLSREMRVKFGLQPLERRIGLAAQDFCHLASGPRVLVTRAERVEGAPSVPSRWLTRLEALLNGYGLALPPPELDFHRLADALDDPGHAPQPATRPQPRPPLAARPRRLSVTRIGMWMHDPYALYAKYVLKLNKLDELEMIPSAREKGNLIHTALERFTQLYPSELPGDPEQTLLEIGRETFAAAAADEAAKALWWARFRRLVPWLARREVEQRASGPHKFSLAEQEGAWTFQAPGGDFTLFCYADRIDLFDGGRVDFIDYKTTKPPSPADVQAGLEPQLALEALIARHGGFETIEKMSEARLSYWQLHGVGPGGKIEQRSAASGSADDLVDQAQEGLFGLLAAFDQVDTAYLARPRAGAALAYNDYELLARITEWGEMEDEA